MIIIIFPYPQVVRGTTARSSPAIFHTSLSQAFFQFCHSQSGLFSNIVQPTLLWSTSASLPCYYQPYAPIQSLLSCLNSFLLHDQTTEASSFSPLLRNLQFVKLMLFISSFFVCQVYGILSSCLQHLNSKLVILFSNSFVSIHD